MRVFLAPIQGAVMKDLDRGVVGGVAPRPRATFCNPSGIFGVLP
jgi:hypothetical protein